MVLKDGSQRAGDTARRIEVLFCREGCHLLIERRGCDLFAARQDEDKKCVGFTPTRGFAGCDFDQRTGGRGIDSSPADDVQMPNKSFVFKRHEPTIANSTA
jgi:hypothetical protein